MPPFDERLPLSGAFVVGILRGSKTLRTRPIDAKQFALDLADLLDENYAGDLAILDVSGPLAIADYFVVATARNSRHAHALARLLMPIAKSQGASFRRQAGLQQKGSGGNGGDSGWALLDFDLVVVHLFDEERRAFYALEDLYADVPRVEFTPRERPDGIPEDAIPGMEGTDGRGGNFEDAFDDLAAFDDGSDSGFADSSTSDQRRNFPDSAWPESVDEI
ncbi:MAG: ribosome silencing factor [Planctomycetota bacterium]